MNSNKSKNLLFAIMIMLAAFAAACAPAARADINLTPAERELDTTIKGFNFQGIDVSQILNMIADDHKLNIIISRQVSGPINLRLNNVTLRKALEEILNMAGAVMIIRDNIIHVYSKSEAPATVGTIDSELFSNRPVTEIYSPIFVDSQNLAQVLTPFLSNDGKIQLFKESAHTNSLKPEVLIITDKPSNIETIKTLAKQLDTETRQVLIQAKIVETVMSNSDLLGVDWTVMATLKGAPFKSDLGDLGKFKLGTLDTEQFSAVLNRLSTSGNANVLSDMSIATLDGQDASLHVGDQIPFGMNTVGAGGGGGIVLGTTGLEQMEVGVRLNVTPHILSEDVVRLEIMPKISQVESFTSLGPNAGSAPVIKERTAETNIMIRSGETVVIGGLVQDSQSDTRKKVPILGDLPVVGGAFRKKETSKSKTDLVIFITATVMEKRLTDAATEPKPDATAVVAPATGQ